MIRLAVSVLCLLVCGGCQGDTLAPPTGPCAPTCAGATATETYADYQSAQKAFARQSEDGTLMATLEDAAWLRFEGDPETVAKNHRAYFDYGYTAFKVLLRASEFTQPTKEQFVLEDSAGARVSGRPVTYQGSIKPVGDRWEYRFDLAFKHTITKELRWLKLTRVADGATVEWTFPGVSSSTRQ